MAVEDRTAPPMGNVGCPDAERLAEYVDGELPPREREEIEAHLVDCSDCRAVVAETSAFVRSAGVTLLPTPAPVAVKAFPRRWSVRLTTGLAAAAALVFVIRLARPELVFGPRTDHPELTELVAALANEPTRPVEGRLTGGFKCAPPPSPTRGPDDREVPPDILIAAAKIEKTLGATPTLAVSSRKQDSCSPESPDRTKPRSTGPWSSKAWVREIARSRPGGSTSSSTRRHDGLRRHKRIWTTCNSRRQTVSCPLAKRPWTLTWKRRWPTMRLPSAAAAASDAGLHQAALMFAEELLATTRDWSNPEGQIDGRLRRARALSELSVGDHGLADLDKAAALLPSLDSRPRARERLAAEIAAARSFSLAGQNDLAALRLLLAAGDAITPPEVAALKLLPGAVVVLGACDTAVGRTFRGEGPMSLVRAFLVAGASSVVAALWKVRDDDATRLLMSVAPGVNVYSTAPGESYAKRDGTSMATAHVAGIAALWAEAEGLRGWALWQRLVARAQRLPSSPTEEASRLVTAP